MRRPPPPRRRPGAGGTGPDACDRARDQRRSVDAGRGRRGGRSVERCGVKLKRGDVITAVNGTPIRSAADLQQVVAAAKAAGRPQVLAQITRGKIAGALIPLRIK